MAWASLTAASAGLDRAIESPPQTTCIWEGGLPRSNEADDDGQCALREVLLHARRHRWSRDAEFEDATIEARCPSSALDVLANTTPPRDAVAATLWRIEAAWCLARNQRHDEALAMLETWSSARGATSDVSERLPERERIAEAQARIAHLAGRHDISFEFALQWHSSNRRGNEGAWTEHAIEHFRIERLSDLGRWDEVRARCVDAVRTGEFDACIGELWIDSFAKTGSLAAPASLLAMLQAHAPTSELAASLDRSLVDAEILQLPIAAQIARISELSWRHVQRLLPRLGVAQQIEFDAACAPIFEVDVTKALRCVEILARSGHPAFEAVLTRARRIPRSESEAWAAAIERARATWIPLARALNGGANRTR